MTEKLSQQMHIRMGLELLNCINVGMKWNVMKKGRTNITRRPRKLGADSFKSVHNIQNSAAFESKKAAISKTPTKKRRLLHQSTSPPPQTLCTNSEGCRSPGPQTPSVLHENSAHRSNSRSKCQKTKSKTSLRNMKMKHTKKLDDFSGIELLAAVACSSFIHENADHVEGFSMSKDHTTRAVKSPGSKGSSVQPTVYDNGKEGEEKKVDPSKAIRLHWDLNTVMEEWEVSCDDSLIESVKHEDACNLVSVISNCNVNSVEEMHESVDDMEVDTKAVIVKTSDGESSGSKSEVVDPLTHPAKCEDLSTSSTSVLKEQTVVNCESETINGLKLDQQPVSEEVIQDFCNNKFSTEDHVSQSCCSNVIEEEHGQTAEGDLGDKIQAGYDSPFEDGEFREPIGTPECDFHTTEDILSEKVVRGQMDHQCSLLAKEAAPNNEIKQGFQAGTFGGKDVPDDDSRLVGGNLLHADESTSFDLCMNGESIHRSRSSNNGDSSMRAWDLKRSLDRNYSRNYNYSRGGGYAYRAQERRPSPPERNNSYGSYRGPPPARSHSGERYRFHSQEYHDRKEIKPQFPSSFNQPGTRSRSRSGSPIAWHFQKRKNSDTNNPGGEFKTETEHSSKCIDDHHRLRDGHFRDKRHETGLASQEKQRYDPIGYVERLKPDDYFRYNQRGVRFSQMTGYKYKDYSEDSRKHDDYFEKGNRVGRDDGARRFRFTHNR